MGGLDASQGASRSPGIARLLIGMILLSLLVSIAAIASLVRINTFQDWALRSVEVNLSLEELELKEPPNEFMRVWQNQRLEALVLEAQTPARLCLSDITRLEQIAAKLFDFAGVFAVCRRGVAAGERMEDTIQMLKAAEISVAYALVRLKVDASLIKRTALLANAYLDRYHYLTLLFLMGGFVSTIGTTVALLRRQNTVIASQFAEATRQSDRLKAAIDSIDDGFAIYDSQDRLVIYNDAYVPLATSHARDVHVGVDRATLLQKTIDDGFYKLSELHGGGDGLADRIVSQANSDVGTPLALADGRHIQLRFRRTQTGDLAIIRTDATSAVQSTKEEAIRARTDPLTSLPNRLAFDEFCEGVSATDTSSRVMIRIDLDNFKLVNDTLGHEAGDYVLTRVGEFLRSAIGPDDFVARLSGDEFAIILASGCTLASSRRIVAAIDAALQTPVIYKRSVCRFGISYGIATMDVGAADFAELMSFADTALYEAKRKGRNRTEVFTQDMKDETLRNRRLAKEIRKALETGEIVPFLQPQVEAATHRLTGFEVLARWQHPELGLLSPAAFLPVASQLRLERQVDAVVFDAIADWVTELKSDLWQHSTTPSFSFNLSADRLRDPELASHAERLVGSGVPTVFEVLESVSFDDERLLSEFRIDALRDAGVQIEIDDFGSGHASILGVRALQPDGIKIDRRLVQPMLRDIHAREIIEAILAISSTMKLYVVAEGVESGAHADALRDMGIEKLQGYAIARPMSLNAALDQMRKNPDGQWSIQKDPSAAA